MSSIRTGIVCAALLALPLPLLAQDSYGPAETAPDESALPSCDDIPPDSDTIIVCSELVDPETVMSVIPPEEDLSEGDIPRAPLLAPPPCWVTKDKAVCIRFGKVPEYPPLIDMTAFPEQLSEDDAAKVMQAELSPQELQERENRAAAIGKRMPIELGDDEPLTEDGG